MCQQNTACGWNIKGELEGLQRGKKELFEMIKSGLKDFLEYTFQGYVIAGYEISTWRDSFD